MVFWVEISNFTIEILFYNSNKLQNFPLTIISKFFTGEADRTMNSRIFAGILGSLAALGIGIVIGLFAIGKF